MMNILFLFLDQLSERALSCAGYPHIATPNIDALAARGVRFTRSYCAAPVCGPSRASVVTGRMPHEHGVLYNGQSIAVGMPTIGEIFRDAGYDTGWSGRWCLPGSGPDIPGFECLHDISQPIGLGTSGDAQIADRAIDFLRRSRDKPFFLTASLCNPHDICYWVMQQSTPHGRPHEQTVRLKEDADAVDFAFAESGELPKLPDNFAINPDEPAFVSRCRARKYYGQENLFTWDWTDETWRRYLRAYNRLTECVDAQVGRVLQVLDASGQRQETLILLTSDHGEGLAGHHLTVKLWLYDEVAAVPFVASWPERIPQGNVDRDHLVSGIDILPTLCDYAGIACPEVTGESVRRHIDDPDAQGRAYVVTELHPDTQDTSMQGRMIRSSHYKYVTYSDGARSEELFDLRTDPGETVNLAGHAKAEKALENHRRHLDQWCAATSDDYLTGMRSPRK